MTDWHKSVFLFVVVLIGSACGGGTGGTGTTNPGPAGTGISHGAITNLGSVVVNGVQFSTTGATITRDDVAINESELRRGMTVEVRGSISSGTSGTATSVSVEEVVRGPVESKSGTASAGTLVVLGQTVRVDTSTLIDNNVPSFGAIATGMLLEIHGSRRGDGEIAATFIESKNAPVVFVVRGTVANHTAGAQTFAVGALNVNYVGANINDMPAPSGSNWNGLLVEVKGTSCASSPVCGTLTATKVEPEGLGIADADRAEIEGFVTALVSTSDFTVDSVRVLTTTSTTFSGGLQDEIAVGVKLEVEGSLASGVLTATKVKFKDSIKLESNATVSGSTITLEGVPGVTVAANTFTEFKNTGATASNIAPLNARNVRIRGRASGATSVIASEIEDRGASDSNADVILQGFVSSTDVSNPTLSILGVTVDTTLLSNDNFKDANGNPIGSVEFFNALTPNGGLVKAKGRLPAAGGNALAAGILREIELED